MQRGAMGVKGREGINEGEVLVSNHPQLAGGSHLPDITVITPVFLSRENCFLLGQSRASCRYRWDSSWFHATPFSKTKTKEP